LRFLVVKVLVSRIEMFVCVPGIGRNATRVISILDTQKFSVFSGSARL
jgi:hypothetical protein